MTRKEAERLYRQRQTLMSLGFTQGEAESLRRISMTLRRWHERECGTDCGCIERGRKERDESGNRVFIHDENGFPYWADHSGDKPRYYRVPDRETGARKRLDKIISNRNVRSGWVINSNYYGVAPETPYLTTYVQTDPRGAALYILRPGDVPEGQTAASCYSRGICVY